MASRVSTFATSTGNPATWGNSDWWFKDYEFDLVTGEPDTLVTTVTAVYTGAHYELSWSGPKNTSQSYTVRYSTTSMKQSGVCVGHLRRHRFQPGQLLRRRLLGVGGHARVRDWRLPGHSAGGADRVHGNLSAHSARRCAAALSVRYAAQPAGEFADRSVSQGCVPVRLAVVAGRSAARPRARPGRPASVDNPPEFGGDASWELNMSRPATMLRR